MNQDAHVIGLLSEALDEFFGVVPKPSRRTLSKCVFTRKQLAKWEKAATIEEQALAKEKTATTQAEKQFFDILSKEFGKLSDEFFKDKATQDAIHALSDPANWYFDKEGKPLRPKPAVWEQYKKGAEEYLGEQLARHVKTRLTITIKDVYEVVKKLNAEQVLDIPYQWNAKTDTNSVSKLNKDVMYWVSTANGRQFEPEVAKVTQEVMAEGLGMRETEDLMKERLGSTYADKSDSYWYLMGNVGVQRARSFSKLSAFEDAGVTEYEIVAVIDNRTSPQCLYMHGKTFTLDKAQKLRDKTESAPTPESVKTRYPWIKYSSFAAKQGSAALYYSKADGSNVTLPFSQMSSDDPTKPNPKAQEMMTDEAKEFLGYTVPLPPYHGNCRTTYLITEKAIQQLTQEQVEEEEELGAPPFNPDELKAAPEGTVGSHGAYWMEDDKGEKFLFKPPSFAKDTDVDPWMNYGLGGLMKEVGFVSVPDFYVSEHKGKPVGIQSKIPNIMQDANGVALQCFNEFQCLEVQKQFVFDWLVGNFDGNRDNHAILQTGIVVGLDKGQAFKCYGNEKLDGKWRPVNNVGLPLFYEMLNAYRDGKDVPLAKFDSPELQGFISKVTSTSPEKLKELFMPYATRAEAAGLQVLDEHNTPVYKFSTEKFFETLFARKATLKDDFAKLYADVEAERAAKLAPPPAPEKPKRKPRAKPVVEEEDLPLGRRVEQDIPFIDSQLLTEAVAARATGKAFLIGGKDWFRNEALVYMVEGTGEGRGLHVEGRLSASASARMLQALGNFNPSSPDGAVVDKTFENEFLPIIKSLKAHNDPNNSHFDGKIKPETEQQFNEVYKKWLATMSSAMKNENEALGDKAMYYLGLLQKCVVNYNPNEDKPLVFNPSCLKETFTPWVPPIESKPKGEDKNKVSEGIIDVKQERRYDWLRERSPSTNKITTVTGEDEKHYWHDSARIITFRLGGVEYEFFPHDKDTPVSLRGKIVARIKDEAKQNTKGVQEALKELQDKVGIETRPATREDLEVAYLRKWAVMTGREDAWKQKVPETEPVEKQLAILREEAARAVSFITKKEVSVEQLLKRDTYNFDVRYQGDVGWAQFGDRFEMTKSEFNKKFEGVTLQHNLSKGIKGLVSNLSKKTPFMTCTEERLRSGINRADEIESSGMSPTSDRASGGSDFHFTRLAKTGRIVGQMVYNRRLLLSLDSTSFPDDNYGAQKGDGRWSNRNETLQDAIGSISRQGNETNPFKWIRLEEHCEAIIVHNDAEKAEVIKALEKAGVKTLSGDTLDRRVVVGAYGFGSMQREVGGDFKA